MVVRTCPLVCSLLLVACGDEPEHADPGPAQVEPVAAPEPERGPPEPKRVDEVACTEFVLHMEVVVAQSLGVPAKTLFTEVERRGAIEHCKRYAHPNLVECGRDVQMLPYLQTCLFFTSVPRPDVEHPSREQCQRYSDRVRQITSVLTTRTSGQVSPAPTPRQLERDVASCVRDFTPDEVACGIEAGSQLALLSCFSAHQASEVGWVTAEECEVYGDHMMEVIGGYLMEPYKPVDATAALAQSGLAAYAVPQLQRFQLVNLCHQLDLELMRCHAKAKNALELAPCVP